MSEVQPQDRDCFSDSLRAAVTGQVAGLLTEPISLKRLAEYFGVNRNLMATIIGTIPGVERFGTLYRLPIWKMPPKYLIQSGLIHSRDPLKGPNPQAATASKLDRAA